MPSKRKKQKTKHFDSGHGSALTHSEVWDDSALIRSWNDALAEYDYYHSIHARGENVDEILRKAEMGELDEDEGESEEELDGNGGWEPVNRAKESSTAGVRVNGGTLNGAADFEGRDDEDEEGEIVEDDDGPADGGEEQFLLEQRRKAAMNHLKSDDPTDQQQMHPHATGKATTVSQQDTAANAPLIGPSLPPDKLVPDGQTHSTPSADQTLENIKMAYYWAGYYSGLYDGQRQAQN